MTTQPLTTIGLVRAYMQEINRCETYQVTDKDLGWFNCKWLAHIILNNYGNTEKLAGVLAHGIQPSKTIESLQDTLDRHWKPRLTVGQVSMADLEVRIQIAEFVGNYVVLKQLKEQSDPVILNIC